MHPKKKTTIISLMVIIGLAFTFLPLFISHAGTSYTEGSTSSETYETEPVELKDSQKYEITNLLNKNPETKTYLENNFTIKSIKGVEFLKDNDKHKVAIVELVKESRKTTVLIDLINWEIIQYPID